MGTIRLIRSTRYLPYPSRSAIAATAFGALERQKSIHSLSLMLEGFMPDTPARANPAPLFDQGAAAEQVRLELQAGSMRVSRSDKGNRLS